MIKLINLLEGIRLDSINNKINALEKEWDLLDSQGSNHERQLTIRTELEKLQKEKQHWNNVYAAINETRSPYPPATITFPMIVWHGGEMIHEKPVLFVTRHKNVAQSYANDRSGKLHKFEINLKNPAKNEVIDKLARLLSIEGSLDDYEQNIQDSPTYEYLSPEMVGHNNVKCMVDNLKKMGYDGAWIDGDYSMDNSFVEYDSFVIWNSSTIKELYD